jgi:phosphate transport system protein
MKTMPGQTLTDRLQQLQGDVLALGSLVGDILLEATDLLHGSELDALERLNGEGREVHRKRLAIEMGCLSLIAGRRPLDGELRHLVAMVEIAAELERLAEHGRRVARANYLTADHRLCKPLASLQRLASEVQGLLEAALDAFVQRDGDAARVVSTGVRETEGLYQQVRQELLTVMKGNRRIANQAIFLSRSAYNLRRASERVAGICAWVVFSVEGSVGGPEQPQVPAQQTEERLLAP